MVKRTLDQTYIHNGKFYGPGEVEVPAALAKHLDARQVPDAELVQPTAQPELHTELHTDPGSGVAMEPIEAPADGSVSELQVTEPESEPAPKRRKAKAERSS